VRLFLIPHNISKNTDASRIIKLDTDMVHNGSWKPIYFGVKRSNVKVTRHKKHVCDGVQKECNIDVWCWVFLASPRRGRYC